MLADRTRKCVTNSDTRQTYPLAEAAQAVLLVEQGRPAGKVIITIP